MKTMLVIGVAALSLSGCATIVKGTDQDVIVNTDPQGAHCELTRDGTQLAIIDPTPGTINVEKSSNDIHITCDMEGYETARFMLESEVQAMTAGNVLFGGVIGLGVDAASGAMNKYDSNVTVIMQRKEAPLPDTGPARKTPARQATPST